MLTGKHICNRKAKRHGSIIPISVQERKARQRLDQQILSGLLFPGAFTAIAADLAVNDPGIYFFYRIII